MNRNNFLLWVYRIAFLILFVMSMKTTENARLQMAGFASELSATRILFHQKGENQVLLDLVQCEGVSDPKVLQYYHDRGLSQVINGCDR